MESSPLASSSRWISCAPQPASRRATASHLEDAFARFTSYTDLPAKGLTEELEVVGGGGTLGRVTVTDPGDVYKRQLQGRPARHDGKA